MNIGSGEIIKAFLGNDSVSSIKLNDVELLEQENTISVLDYGVTGNGITDDTEAIQSVLNSYDNIYFPDGTYLINAAVSIKPRSSQNITLADNAILKAIPNNLQNYEIVELDNVSNVAITGGQILGERDNHIGTTGEWGHGIAILNGSDNITISDLTVSKCWGDGIYLGGATKVTNVTVNNIISTHNRRQGMSITNAEYVFINNSKFKNTSGTAPEAGIDIEPNTGQTAKNIYINECEMTDNNGIALELRGIFAVIDGVYVDGCLLKNSWWSGLAMENVINSHFANMTIENNDHGIEIYRDVRNSAFDNLNINRNYDRGVTIVGTSQNVGIDDLAFTDCVMSNNGYGYVNQRDGCRIDNIDNTKPVTNISFVRCQFIDNQVSKTQRYGLTVGYSAGISNITATTDCVFSGNISGNYIDGGILEFI